MSTPLNFQAKSTKAKPPIEFTITAEDGSVFGPFRATNKPRLDLLQTASRAVVLDKGVRVQEINILTHIVYEFLVQEIWVPDESPGDDGTVDPDKGEWVKVDDRDRFIELMNSDRYYVDEEQLGAIATALIEMTTKNPTGASKAS
jgi:hypothetical protein